jgi:hypothetical protein
MADNAPKYVVEIVGWDGAKVRSYAGEPSIRKLDFDSNYFQITEVVGVGPSKLSISLRPEIASALDGLAALTARVAALEAIILDRIVHTNTGLQFIDSLGAVLFQYGITDGNAKGIGFYTVGIMPRPVSSASSPTLAEDLGTDLASLGIITLTA